MEASFIETFGQDWLIQLPVAIISTVERLESDQFRRVRRQVGRVFLVLFRRVAQVLQLI